VAGVLETKVWPSEAGRLLVEADLNSSTSFGVFSLATLSFDIFSSEDALLNVFEQLSRMPPDPFLQIGNLKVGFRPTHAQTANRAPIYSLANIPSADPSLTSFK
jgi:hypothetical protein